MAAVASGPSRPDWSKTRSQSDSLIHVALLQSCSHIGSAERLSIVLVGLDPGAKGQFLDKGWTHHVPVGTSSVVLFT